MKKKRKNFRLPNGAGSVYKLSGNRRNPWTAVMHLGYADDGRNIRKYIGYYPTYEEALHGLEMYKETPFDLNNKDITVSRLYELLSEKNKDRPKNTNVAYRTAYNHLAPFHNKPIRALHAHHWQTLLDNLTLSPASKAIIKALINQLYKIAVRLDVVNKSAIPTLEIDRIEQSGIHVPFTELEIRKLWETAKTNPFAEIPLLLCYTGMRPQELLNVKIEDINLDAGFIMGGLKTKAGRQRKIPIHDSIKGIIIRRATENNNYLVQSAKGGKMYYQRLLSLWHELMDEIHLSHLPHDGRCTFASAAKKQKIDPFIVKKIMGHRIDDVTERYYTHISEEDLIIAVNMI